MAELEVDGVRLADVSPRAWQLLRSGQVEYGERRWIREDEVDHAVAVGWSRVGHDPESGFVLVWKPRPAADRRLRKLACARCGLTNPDFLSFGVGFPTRAVYCLHHVPWWVRLRMWWREVRGRG